MFRILLVSLILSVIYFYFAGKIKELPVPVKKTGVFFASIITYLFLFKLGGWPNLVSASYNFRIIPLVMAIFYMVSAMVLAGWLHKKSKIAPKAGKTSKFPRIYASGLMIGYLVFVSLLLLYQIRLNTAWLDYSRDYLRSLKAEFRRFDLAGEDKGKLNYIEIDSTGLASTPLFAVFSWPWSDPALSIALKGGDVSSPIFYRSSYTDYLYYQEVAKWLKKEVNFK